MNGIEMIKTRRSIRKFTDEKVAREVIENIMETARFTQSWKNTQTARFTFVQNEEMIGRIANEGVNGFIYNIKTLQNAKNVAVLSYVTGVSGMGEEEYATSKGGEWEVFDAGIACQTFTLAAHAEGIGTCVMGIIDDSKIGEIIGLSAGQKVGALIVFGHPAQEGREPQRLTVDELTTFIS